MKLYSLRIFRLLGVQNLLHQCSGWYKHNSNRGFNAHKDHIGFLLIILRGQILKFGPRFPDMSESMTKSLWIFQLNAQCRTLNKTRNLCIC